MRDAEALKTQLNLLAADSFDNGVSFTSVDIDGDEVVVDFTFCPDPEDDFVADDAVCVPWQDDETALIISIFGACKAQMS
jgi:hypothetical protein